MLSQPVFEFTPVRAPHEAVVNIAWVKLHRMFCLFPFSCSTFSKSSFCYEQALGQGHQSQCQCITVHHTVIPARVPSMENSTRHKAASSSWNNTSETGSLTTVSTSSRPTGLRLSHGESMIQLPSLLLNASVLPRGTGNLTISGYFC